MAREQKVNSMKAAAVRDVPRTMVGNRKTAEKTQEKKHETLVWEHETQLRS